MSGQNQILVNDLYGRLLHLQSLHPPFRHDALRQRSQDRIQYDQT